MCEKEFKPLAYSWLIGKVKNNADYDIKVEESWNGLFNKIGNNIPFYGASFPVYFNGKEINAEIFGNILFGYISNAGGFSCDTIVWGGSVYSMIKTGEADNESDSTAIENGYTMYETVKGDYEYLHT